MAPCSLWDCLASKLRLLSIYSASLQQTVQAKLRTPGGWVTPFLPGFTWALSEWKASEVHQSQAQAAPLSCICSDNAGGLTSVVFVPCEDTLLSRTVAPGIDSLEFT